MIRTHHSLAPTHRGLFDPTPHPPRGLRINVNGRHALFFPRHFSPWYACTMDLIWPSKILRSIMRVNQTNKSCLKYLRDGASWGYINVTHELHNIAAAGVNGIACNQEIGTHLIATAALGRSYHMFVVLPSNAAGSLHHCPAVPPHVVGCRHQQHPRYAVSPLQPSSLSQLPLETFTFHTSAHLKFPFMRDSPRTGAVQNIKPRPNQTCMPSGITDHSYEG